MFRFFLFGFVLVGLLFSGCGTDEVLTPGEEVVEDEWIDPVDIGKDYTVGDPKTGDVILLSSGERYEIGPLFLDENFELMRSGIMVDSIITEEDGSRIIASSVFEAVPGEPNSLSLKERVLRGTIVPEGPPVVSIVGDFLLGENPQATPENNYQDRLDFVFRIKIDRILGYNLPIYLEYQTQDREELEGEVRRVRFLTVVLKGDIYAKKIYDEGNRVHVGSRERHERASISILPHTDMEKINLPVDLDIAHSIPLEDRRLLEGHVFRPYRIASSSFLMGEVEIERNW